MISRVNTNDVLKIADVYRQGVKTGIQWRTP